MKRTDTVTALVFISLGGAVLYQTTRFNQTLITDNYLGATFFPRIVAATMILMGLVLFVGSFRSNLPEKNTFFTSSLWRPLGGVLLLIFYISIMEPLGFLISTWLLNLGVLFLLRVRSRLTFSVLPLGATLLVYVVFYKVLGVPLPEGLFFF